ncbi:hypothetical protein [Herbaspirillum sp. RV1423]|uniref:hypothetical protein n=1 Tax=Herbaspirillum sp. RV1423 TaxID=1443993 RepID=UPI0004AE8D95|nr:hypothetical protein [Herbaspirillum sp. RV1423]
MRTTTARHNRSVPQLAAAVLLFVAAGSVFADNAPKEADKGNQVNAQQAVRQPSKASIKRREILQKVANHEPLTYEETLYLR